jgi:hypothetical protein
MNSAPLLITVALIQLFCALLASTLAGTGRDFKGFALGILCGPAGVVMAAFLGVRVKLRERRADQKIQTKDRGTAFAKGMQTPKS